MSIKVRVREHPGYHNLPDGTLGTIRAWATHRRGVNAAIISMSNGKFDCVPIDLLTAIDDDPVAVDEAPAATAIIRALVEHIERNTCCHDSTHRAGFHLTVCDQCGASWKDDEGGKPEFKWPTIVTEAREFLRGGK